MQNGGCCFGSSGTPPEYGPFTNYPMKVPIEQFMYWYFDVASWNMTIPSGYYNEMDYYYPPALTQTIVHTGTVYSPGSAPALTDHSFKYTSFGYAAESKQQLLLRPTSKFGAMWTIAANSPPSAFDGRGAAPTNIGTIENTTYGHGPTPDVSKDWSKTGFVIEICSSYFDGKFVYPYFETNTYAVGQGLGGTVLNAGFSAITLSDYHVNYLLSPIQAGKNCYAMNVCDVKFDTFTFPMYWLVASYPTSDWCGGSPTNPISRSYTEPSAISIQPGTKRSMS